MGDERCPSQCDRFAIAEHPIDRMGLAIGFDCLECRDILGHSQHLRASQFLDQRVAFLVIAVRVSPEQDLDVAELEPELRD